LALHLAHNDSDRSEHAFTRATFEWESDGRESVLVVERTRDGRVRLEVTVGSEREEHDLDLDPNRIEAINAASKLIKIEETGASLPEGTRVPPPPHERATRVRQQSKLITIEDLSASLPEATLVVR
jgi:hypothetical protein